MTKPINKIVLFFMLLTITSVILLLFVSFCAGADKPSKPVVVTSNVKVGLLDGMRFVGTITEKGKTKGGSEALSFDKGKLITTTFLAYGFNTTAYSAEKQKDGSFTFKCEITSSKPDMGKTQWDGTVKDKSVNATVQWTKKGGKKVEYTIKADKK